MPHETRSANISAYVFYQSDPTKELKQKGLGTYTTGCWAVWSSGANYMLKTKAVNRETLMRFRELGDCSDIGIIGKKQYDGPSERDLIAFNHIWSPRSNLKDAIPLIVKEPYVRMVSFLFGGLGHDGLMGEITVPPDKDISNFKEIGDWDDLMSEYNEVFWSVVKQAFPTPFYIVRELEV